MTNYAEGYIEKREVLVDGSLPAGQRDAGKLRKEMYFAKIDSPGYWYGPLRDTEEQAVQDGRRYCEKVGFYVPCFGMSQ